MGSSRLRTPRCSLRPTERVRVSGRDLARGRCVDCVDPRRNCSFVLIPILSPQVAQMKVPFRSHGRALLPATRAPGVPPRSPPRRPLRAPPTSTPRTPRLSHAPPGVPPHEAVEGQGRRDVSRVRRNPARLPLAEPGSRRAHSAALAQDHLSPGGPVLSVSLQRRLARFLSRSSCATSASPTAHRTADRDAEGSADCSADERFKVPSRSVGRQDAPPVSCPRLLPRVTPVRGANENRDPYAGCRRRALSRLVVLVRGRWFACLYRASSCSVASFAEALRTWLWPSGSWMWCPSLPLRGREHLCIPSYDLIGEGIPPLGQKVAKIMRVFLRALCVYCVLCRVGHLLFPHNPAGQSLLCG